MDDPKVTPDPSDQPTPNDLTAGADNDASPSAESSPKTTDNHATRATESPRPASESPDETDERLDAKLLAPKDDRHPPKPRQPDNRQQSDRPKRSESSSPASNSMIWLVVLIVAVVVLFAALFSPKQGFQIDYGDLYALVEQGPGGSIEITTGEDDKEKTIRVSDLDDLVMPPNSITGTVTTQVVKPESEKTEPEENVKFTCPRYGIEAHTDEFMDFAKENGFPMPSGAQSPGMWQSFLPMLIFLGFFLVMFLFLLRRISGAGGAVAFGRSRGRFAAQEDVGISFDDVAGIDEAVDELREVVDFLKNPGKYRILGGRIPKGVLLVGPPGTGKTLLAKAVAGEAHVPFLNISGSDFVEMFVGVGAARVRDMFQQAQQKAPCIIFIDELDALGKARGSGLVGGHDEREQTLNALLVEMDGFGSNSGIMIMAATNRPEMLDPALLRPGRFDRNVLVDRPDVRGREEILRVHVAGVKLDDEIDLAKVAGITSGFAGADLANLVNEAALLAAREGKPAVTMREFNEGVERVTAGLEKRQRVIHEDEKQRIAYHEAGHALVAHLTHATDPVHKISIIPRGFAALGYTMQRPEGDRYLMTRAELCARIRVLVAGTIAEELVFNGDVSTGAQNDLQRATDIARSMVMDFGMSRLGRVTFRAGKRSAFLSAEHEIPAERAHSEQTAREIDEEIARLIDEAIEETTRLLESRKETLIDLAERLIERETIGYDELCEVVDANAPEKVQDDQNDKP